MLQQETKKMPIHKSKQCLFRLAQVLEVCLHCEIHFQVKQGYNCFIHEEIQK